MRVGITIFGSAANFPADAIIQEYKQFVENNSKIRLDLVVTKLAKLSTEEIAYYPPGNCYFVSYASLTDANKSKLPSDVAIQIIMWDYEGKSICWAGGTYGGDVPFISIPFAYYADQPCGPQGPWKHSYAQIIFHEWLHCVDILLDKLGFSAFPSADECGKYGYNGVDDPCWQQCYKYFLSLITDEMYRALGESVTTTGQKISTIALVGAIGAATAWTVMQQGQGTRGAVH